jgi:hypothetical protein
MMGLVPVRDSIVRGYSFLFARFFTVLGLGWMPAAFYGLACAWLIRAVSTGALGAPPSSGAFNQYSLGYLVAMLIVTAFFGAPMLIPFTREALGMHEEPVAAHFSYGPREWRLFVALLRFYAIVGAVLFTLIVGSGIAISQFAGSPIVWLGVPIGTWLNSVSAVIVLSTAAFLAVRLGFFLGPIAAMEGHASLTRAWALSRDNFWRLSLVFLAVAIPALLVVLICEYALWGSELEMATLKTGSNALAIFQLQYDHSESIAAMMAVALMAVNALFGAASAYAYRAQDAEVGETAASAPESNWGINRAPVTADAGGVHVEPAAPVVKQRADKITETLMGAVGNPVEHAPVVPALEAPEIPVIEGEIVEAPLHEAVSPAEDSHAAETTPAAIIAGAPVETANEHAEPAPVVDEVAHEVAPESLSDAPAAEPAKPAENAHEPA